MKEFIVGSLLLLTGIVLEARPVAIAGSLLNRRVLGIIYFGSIPRSSEKWLDPTSSSWRSAVRWVRVFGVLFIISGVKELVDGFGR